MQHNWSGKVKMRVAARGRREYNSVKVKDGQSQKRYQDQSALDRQRRIGIWESAILSRGLLTKC